MNIQIQADTDNKKNLLKSLGNSKIEFKLINFFDEYENCYLIPEDSEKEKLIIFDCHMLEELFYTDIGIKSLFNFLKNNKNRIWIYQDADVTFWLKYEKLKKILLTIDEEINFRNFSIIHDSHLVENSFFHYFKKVNNYFKPLTTDFSDFPTLSEKIKKKESPKSFLLTTIVLSDKFHRKNLVKQLQKKNNLLNNFRMIIHKNKTDARKNWVGEQSHVHGWQDGNPSIDLYNNSYFELVPETEYKHLYYITEKTIKPIATMTPFLILSTKGYLNFLRKMGFKTFDGIIDESYDLEHRVEDRSRMIISEFENILNKDPKIVYEQCLPILEYNFHHLLYLCGSHDFKHDEFIRDCLTKTKKRQNS